MCIYYRRVSRYPAGISRMAWLSICMVGKLWVMWYVIASWYIFSHWYHHLDIINVLLQFLWNCPQMNITGLDRWQVTIALGIGLVSSGNKHYHSQCWPRCFLPHGITRLHWVTVETLYNTINFCWNTHKRHSIARPKGRGMECLLWVQRATYCVDLSKLSSIKYLL